MNNEIVSSADVKKEQETKPAAKVKKVSKPKARARKAAPKKLRKAQKAKRKAAKPAVKKPMQRRKFPYQIVLKMWKSGKTMETIARAVGRYQQTADDPLHSFRVSLMMGDNHTSRATTIRIPDQRQ